MSLKQLIKQKKLLESGAVDAKLVLPGEPMIYSIKYSIGSRTRSVQFFRNEKWKSLLKSFFRSYYKTHVGIVVIVRFYVTPPERIKIKAADLRNETMPAVHAYEICDYLLSFLEMLHHVLINSYCQIVKVDAEKYYSDNPRTVFQFMKWDHYVQLQNNNTIHTESKGLVEDRQVRKLQSELPRNATDSGICQEAPRVTLPPSDYLKWSSPCSCAFPDTGTIESTRTQT